MTQEERKIIISALDYALVSIQNPDVFSTIKEAYNIMKKYDTRQDTRTTEQLGRTSNLKVNSFGDSFNPYDLESVAKLTRKINK